MSQYIVKKSVLHGALTVPPSKSQTLRAILFGSIASGKTVIENYLLSPDAFAMMNACKSLGAKLNVGRKKIEIEGVGKNIVGADNVIDAGNSGIVLRFISAIAALGSQPIVITGDESIRNRRPMAPMISALQQLGADVVSTRGNGFAPLVIKGPIRSGHAIVLGEDSQPVSSLLIAAPLVEGKTEIVVKSPGEKPWILLTLDWLKRMGVQYKNNDFEHYTIEGGHCYEGFHYSVPGDLSSAAFPVAAALITNSELTLQNVDMDDLQGDKELIYTFIRMGALIEIDAVAKTLHVKKGSKLKGIEVDINSYIDGITILTALACYAEGEMRIKNASVARQKECNRIDCLVKELSKMGADISEQKDGLLIRKSQLKGAQVFSHHDHRMAMSLAIAGLGADGETIVDEVECVSKTFPTFLEDFCAVGAAFEVNE